jgi:hypothetical protein
VSVNQEQTVREFLAPLRSVPPVQRRGPERTTASRRLHPLAMIGIPLAMIALVGVIALIAHRPAQQHPVNTAPNRFAHLRGWIVINAQQLTAIDPAQPHRWEPLEPWRAAPLEWSRDGSALLVARFGGAGGLWVLHADGATNRVAPTHADSGTFTPDGSHVIYSLGGSLFIVGSDGRHRRTLAQGRIGRVYVFPGLTGGEMSPDGTTIFLGAVNNISTVHSDGTGYRRVVTSHDVLRLTGDSRLYEIEPLAWFPDSRRLLLAAFPQNGPACATLSVNSNGTGLRRWGPPGICPIRATLGGDGRHFAFTGGGPRRRQVVTLADVNGTNVRGVRVPRELYLSMLGIGWAPSGR